MCVMAFHHCYCLLLESEFIPYEYCSYILFPCYTIGKIKVVPSMFGGTASGVVAQPAWEASGSEATD